jgi:hypothetical protein
MGAGSLRWRRITALLLAGAVAVACGSRTGLLADDLGDASTDGGFDASADTTVDGTTDADPDADADAPDGFPDVIIAKCNPRSCADQDFECGINGDGCGNAIDCGNCPAPQVCGSQAYSKCAKGPPCVPKTCQDLGFNCGPAGDGCGGILQCGFCSFPDVCGGKGVPGNCGNSRPCTNLCQQQVTCDAGTTTVTGVVVAGTLPQYGAPDPIYNALVYVPNAPLAAFPQGVSCDHCGASVSGEPLVVASTAADGSFTLSNVPVGTNIPLVIQLGRWRRVVTIPNVAPCTNTALPRDLTRMPRNSNEGDIPKIAVATGNADGIECVLLKAGIDQAEFTQPSGSGRVNIFVANGSNAGAGTPPMSALVSSPSTLAKYDMVLLPCEAQPLTKAPSDQQNIVDYTAAGGRVFATHYSYTWLYNIAPFNTTANFNTSVSGSPSTTGVIDTSFTNGQALSTWMNTVGALTGPNQFAVQEPRFNIDAVLPPSQGFVYDLAGQNRPLQYAFYTPVAVPPAQQCGRVVYSTFHVVSNNLTTGTTFPAECRPGPMTPQERDLEFMLFDLANCIPSAPQNCTPRSCQAQGIACGPAGDGCGGQLSCGTCTPPQTCGGGTHFTCSVPDAGTCIPKTCKDQGFDCGANGDGCGGLLQCGTCVAPQICGGGGQPGKCGGP